MVQQISPGLFCGTISWSDPKKTSDRFFRLTPITHWPPQLLTSHQSLLTSHIRRLSFELPVPLVDDDIAIGLTRRDHGEHMLGVWDHDIEHIALI
jgi:hypothetical protein